MTGTTETDGGIPDGVNHKFVYNDITIWSDDTSLNIEQGDNKITVPIGGNAFMFLEYMWHMEDALMDDVEP